MANRIERLLGAQVLEKITFGNVSTYTSAYVLQNVEPFTCEPANLSVPELKECVRVNSSIVYKEVQERLNNFVVRFNDDKAINKGLATFNVQRQAVDRDAEEVVRHTDNLGVVHALIDDYDALANNGRLLYLYRDDTQLEFDVSIHVNKEDEPINQFQDLLNAIALELQGICSYQGTLRYPSFPERVPLVASRLRVATMLKTRVKNLPEVSGFIKALERTKLELPDAKTEDDLAALGVWLSSAVPQLPLLRRWWNIK